MNGILKKHTNYIHYTTYKQATKEKILRLLQIENICLMEKSPTASSNNERV